MQSSGVVSSIMCTEIAVAPVEELLSVAASPRKDVGEDFQSLGMGMP